jgi:hypothetical protein
MFQCRCCGHSTFTVETVPGLPHTVEILPGGGQAGETLIRVGTYEFVADLMFLNEFATCAQCEATGEWTYQLTSSALPAEVEVPTKPRKKKQTS